MFVRCFLRGGEHSLYCNGKRFFSRFFSFSIFLFSVLHHVHIPAPFKGKQLQNCMLASLKYTCPFFLILSMHRPQVAWCLMTLLPVHPSSHAPPPSSPFHLARHRSPRPHSQPLQAPLLSLQQLLLPPRPILSHPFYSPTSEIPACPPTHARKPC